MRYTEGAARAATPTIPILGDHEARNVAEKLRPQSAFISEGAEKKKKRKFRANIRRALNMPLGAERHPISVHFARLFSRV